MAVATRTEWFLKEREGIILAPRDFGLRLGRLRELNKKARRQEELSPRGICQG